MKNKPLTIELDEDAQATFAEASDIVAKAGLRVPTAQLVQAILNSEIHRLNPRKIAQRFLKSVIQQVGGAAGSLADDDEEISAIPKP